MSLKTPKTLRMLRKTPALNAWNAIFKNVDFSWNPFKVTKLSKVLAFFLFKILHY